MFQCLNGVRQCAILRGTKQGHFEMETTQLKKKKNTWDWATFTTCLQYPQLHCGLCINDVVNYFDFNF